jgi:E3 ubiquitin ligase
MQVIAILLAQVYASSHADTRIEFWAAIGAVFGVVLFVRGFQMLRYKRLVLNTPESKIRSASMGLVEIEGMAKGPQTIPAGITGDPCFYYRAVAWRLESDGKNRRWQCVADERLFIPFYLEDPTGRMLVNAQGADLDVHCNFKDEFGATFFGTKDVMLANTQQFLTRYGLASADRIRLEEYCIKPEYPLFVLGTLGANTAQQDWQQNPASHFVLSKTSHKSNFSIFGPTGSAVLRLLGVTPGGEVTVVDLKGSSAAGNLPSVWKDPAVQAASWSAVSMDDAGMANVGSAIARHAASAQSTSASPGSVAVADRVLAPPPVPAAPARSKIDESGFQANPTVAISKGTNGTPFTISSSSQREVVKALAWKSTLCIWGGPILTLVCLYILGISFGWIAL